MEIHCLDPKGVNEYERRANIILSEEMPSTWKAYSGLQLVGKKDQQAEFDLIIFTADRIIVVELKDWYGKLFSKNGKWVIQRGQYQEPRENGLRSAIRAAKILKSLILSRLKSKLSSIPYVESCVVLTGEATAEDLPQDEKSQVFTLDEFKKFGNPKKLNSAFGEVKSINNNQDRPNQNLNIWDNFFINDSGNFKPRVFTHAGYAIEGSAFFKHKNSIYSEYISFQTTDNSYKAIMRKWDFNHQSIANYSRTAEERNVILHRESKVLSYIDSEDEDLMDTHLSYIPSDSIGDIELFTLPRNKLRLDEYILSNWKKLSKQNKIEIITIFISHLARLHKIGVAHQDLGSHSVWLSNSSLGITLSNFLAASFPKDTHKKISANLTDLLAHQKIKLPENSIDSNSTPFTRDVFLTGSIVHFLAFGSWPNTLEDGVYFWKPIENDLFEGALDTWFKKSLDYKASNRFENLEISFDFFENTNIKEGIESIESLGELEKYYKETNIYAEYAHQQIREPKGTSLFYKSTNGDSAIKIWNGVSPQNSDSSLNIYLISFLNRIQTLKNSKIDGIPKIIEFGYNKSFQALFVSYQWIDGEKWNTAIARKNKDEILILILGLIKSTVELHKNKLTHGSINPEHIICQGSAINKIPIFVNLFEFSPAINDSEINEYSPENFLDIPLISRDRFAIIKIIKEASQLSNIESITSYCNNLLKQVEITGSDLNRFLDNFENIANPIDADLDLRVFVIKGRNFSAGITEMTSDSGNYYISTRVEDSNTLRLFLSGQNQQVTIKIDLAKADIGHTFVPKNTTHNEFIKSKRFHEILFKGKIKFSQNTDSTSIDFVKEILNNEIVNQKILNYRNLQLPKEQRVIAHEDIKHPINKIWREMVETEYSINPKVFLTSAPIESDDLKNIYNVSYINEGSRFDFDLKKERVTIKRENNDYLKVSGFVESISKGNIEFKNNKSNTLEDGDSVYLISNLADSSLRKRRNAVEAIINGRATIPNLVNYFDTNMDCEPDEITNPSPSETEIDLYTEKNFKFNNSQKDAFKKLHQYGPLGLLQGPPGTGKTAFIGAFIHYSILKGSKKILLVSQSHEAVNNAAEKVREIFRKQNESVSIIRLGDEEHISDSLADISEDALQKNYRELFRAEIKQRIILAAKNLSLPIEFIETSLDFELSFGRNIDTYQKNENNKNLNNWLEKLSNFFIKHFDHKVPFDQSNLNDTHTTFYKLAEHKFQIDSPLHIEKYRDIVNISFEWIAVMSSSKSQFQNFLVKTRTVVCGTCVGIARLHYGVNENIYDLVVIDEASRASSSELAIAMQIGRKVILVGDHKQLPPQYDDEHINKAVEKIGNITSDELRRSDFERSFLSNYGKLVGQRLSVQYRMAPAIGSLISYCFYDSLLDTGRGEPINAIASLPDKLGTTVTWLDTSPAAEKSFDRRPSGKNSNQHSFENEFEANVIIKLLEELSVSKNLNDFLLTGDSPQIGVICMYKEQVRLLRKKLQGIQWLRNLQDDGILKIDTVDSYQGKENSIIIVSLVRNNHELIQGFLKHESRANVALSRAKERLYIVGSTSMWNKKNINSPFGRVLSYIQNEPSSQCKVLNSNDLET